MVIKGEYEFNKEKFKLEIVKMRIHLQSLYDQDYPTNELLSSYDGCIYIMVYISIYK